VNNAKEILKFIPVDARRIFYLAVLEAINEYLLKKGSTKKELPPSVDAYRKALQKYIAVDNGKY